MGLDGSFIYFRQHYYIAIMAITLLTMTNSNFVKYIPNWFKREKNPTEMQSKFTPSYTVSLLSGYAMNDHVRYTSKSWLSVL